MLAAMRTLSPVQNLALIPDAGEKPCAELRATANIRNIQGPKP